MSKKKGSKRKMDALLTPRELLDDLMAEQIPRMVDAFCSTTGVSHDRLKISIDPVTMCWVVEADGARASGASLDSVLRRLTLALLAGLAA